MLIFKDVRFLFIPYNVRADFNYWVNYMGAQALKDVEIVQAIYEAKDKVNEISWKAKDSTVKAVNAHTSTETKCIKREIEKLRNEMAEIKKDYVALQEVAASLASLWKNRKIVAVCILLGIIFAISGPSGVIYKLADHEKDIIQIIDRVIKEK